MSKFFITLLTVLCLTGCTGFSTTATKQEVLLAKMEKAVDPEGIAHSWKTIIIKMQLKIPMQQLKMSVTGLYKFPDKSKVVAVMPGILTETQVFNGRQAWKETAGLGIQMKTGIQLAFAEFECRKTNPALKMTEIYEKITLDPDLYQIGEFSCHKLICTLPAELNVAPTQLFVDNKEFLIRSSIENQLTDMGVVPVTLIFSDYKIVNGIKTAMLVNMNMMGIKMIGKLLSVKVNEKIADSEFQLPKDK
ncbi:MAG: hypothetical protein KAS17_08265 [Victivallaceae bacterium]|nr:hypothetical protein [Victivallaceae bacterium]